MQKTHYLRKDWFVALVAGVLVAGAAFVNSPFLQRLELAAYDLGVRVTHRAPGAAEQIVIVAIDDASLDAVGRWPWPRRALAEGLARLSKAKPRAVALLLDLSEPQIDPGLNALRDVRGKLADIDVPKQAAASFAAVHRLLADTERELDNDRALAGALAATPRLHLPMFAVSGAEDGAPLPAYLARHRLQVRAADGEASTGAAARLRAPLDAFGLAARGVGHLGFRRDPDGGARAFYAALRADGHYYPSLPLLVAASSLNLDGRHLEWEVGQRVRFGKVDLPTDADGLVQPGFYGGARAFAAYSFHDVQAERVPLSAFTNKIVLIGVTAASAGPSYVTPVSGALGSGTGLFGDEAASKTLSLAEVTANMIAAVLNEDAYTRPAWAKWVEPALALVLLFYLMLVVPRLSAKTATFLTVLLLLGLVVAAQFLMVTQKLWLQTASPAFLLIAGHLAILGKRFIFGERVKLETDSAHTNRMLGLALQSQGQLDMAMDKFRKLPVDESVCELFYNLALDFERKRQFHKAAAAYDYILEHRRNFRDCAERKQRAAEAENTVALGRTLIHDGAAKPTLGRYQIERELGRGEMGIVYLGIDPKINRRVAIKTLVLSPEMQAKELGNLRERFFREAEAAGRLHHPNIVTIYDVGEDADLAYIAMEYLEGKELASYVDPKKPMPIEWVLDVAIQVADALAYAHRNSVVHRDIKPSNIVYHEASGNVKVMDFGIARVNAANRTKTGLVLGTPSYMSPEQISGKRVDGRADLYAVGAMLFELLTGDTPYDADSFAALMHQIVNAPVPDLRKRRPDAPPRLVAIVRRLLQKQVTKRYQTGDELKQDLEECRDALRTAASA